MQEFNFEILSDSLISTSFKHLGILSFQEAAQYICNLPYKRNVFKDNVLCVFDDGGGTCSTKHALLKTLAIENNKNDLKLFVGIFRMNSFNTPMISSCLENYHLSYIPEAHCYLKYNHEILDFTGVSFLEKKFIVDLLDEFEIASHQISDYKVSRHQNFLSNWLNEHREISYSMEEIWKIREECIKLLSKV